MGRSLEGKLAIVTGASRGIGTAIAQNLASKGCNVVLGFTSDSSQSRTYALAEDLEKQHGVHAIAIQADVGTAEGPSFLVEMARKQFVDRSGKPADDFRVDILINNAGVALNNKLPDVTAQDFDTSYRVNVMGPMLLVQAAAPYLPTDRSGRIVNLSSVSSSVGFPGQTVYGGTKAALEAMTRTWARELSERATVNAVNPGPVLTEMYESNTPEFKRFIRGFIEHTPLMRAREGVDDKAIVEDAVEAGGRPAYAEEIAGVVGMLCSHESGWCTGQVVSANGGMLFGMQ